MCALLHDNALTQYISEELKKDSVIDLKKDLSEEKTNLHCIYGEKNITKLPFKTDVSNVILYHHEHADGTGSFQKKWNEIPLFARIIHLADIIDIIRNSIDSDDNSWDLWGTVTIGSKGQIVIPKAARETYLYVSLNAQIRNITLLHYSSTSNNNYQQYKAQPPDYAPIHGLSSLLS